MLVVKGPALYAYNDAVFSEDDWKGIRMLLQSVKQHDQHKIGYFGMGFKSVFHITGTPAEHQSRSHTSGVRAYAVSPVRKIHDFYRAMLCIRGTSDGPVSVSVCLSVCHKSEFY